MDQNQDINVNDNFQGQTDTIAQPQPVAATPTSPTTSQDDADLESLKNMSNEEFLEAFAKGLLVEKGLGEMDDETRAEMIKDLVERITTFVNRAVLEALPEDKLEQINQLADGDVSVDEINKVVQESGIDTDQITTNALEKFRSIYLDPNKENTEA